VAGSGFDLRGRGGVDLVNEVGAGKSKSLKKLKVEVKVNFRVFWPYFY